MVIIQHVSPSHELSDSAGSLLIRPAVLKSLHCFTNSCIECTRQRRLPVASAGNDLIITTKERRNEESCGVIGHSTFRTAVHVIGSSNMSYNCQTLFRGRTGGSGHETNLHEELVYNRIGIQ